MSILFRGAVNDSGELTVVNGSSIPNHFHNGIPYESNGSLAIDLAGAVDHYHQGLPFTLEGRLVSELTASAPEYAGSGAAVFTASTTYQQWRQQQQKQKQSL